MEAFGAKHGDKNKKGAMPMELDDLFDEGPVPAPAKSGSDELDKSTFGFFFFKLSVRGSKIKKCGN